MLFNSLTFLAFFAVVLVVDRLLPSWRARKQLLLVASYLFYAAWNPPFVLLIWLSTGIDWFAARAMGRSSTPGVRRALLVLSLLSNLGLLGFFKYGAFLTETAVHLGALVGLHWVPPAFDIILPVGISFYTFQTLSYTIDVYRGQLRPSDSFLDFALFVTFFPQLVAGPIVRAAEFLPQCAAPRRASAGQLGWGMTLLLVGLVAKTTLADGLMAPIADTVYSAAGRAGFLDAWVGTLAFSAQIFFDFAGYSTCAIGIGLCLGFALPDNFRYPYAAVGFSDFWRRWHVSLSSWLRDYLYIPLGGNRGGPMRVQANLMLTMLLGGLWHGASWRFVVWGGLHGAYLAVERHLRGWHARRGGSPLSTPVRIVLAGLTYYLVCVTWVFFRAADFGSAFRLVTVMHLGGADRLALGVGPVLTVSAVTAVLLGWQWWMRDRSLEEVWARIRWPLRAAALAAMILVLLFTRGDERAFIYFQF